MANILIAAVKYPVASGRYMTDAFRRLGHTVYVVGPETGNKVWGIEVNPDYAWHEAGIPAGWKPDLCITMGTDFNPVLNYDCPHVAFCVDNHVRNLGDKKAYPAKYSRYFLAHHDGPAMPVCDCYDAPCTWLPCAYDPVWFTPSPIPMAERTYDVALIGVGYPRRIEIVEAMHLAGLKVFAAMGPLYDEFRSVYHNSKISLCVSAAQDVAQRLYETGAMGNILLSDRLNDCHRVGLTPFNTTAGVGPSNYWLYDSVNEAIDIAIRLCRDTHPIVLDEMGRAAQRWASPNTWDSRCEIILKTMKMV